MNGRVEIDGYSSSNSKTYLNGDGTISVEIYDQNINEPMLLDTTDESTGGIVGSNNPLNISDTYISSSGTSTGNEDKVKIGVEKVNSKDVIHRTLLKFDLPKIPSSFTLVNASLNMIGYYDENYNDNDSNVMIGIHQLKKDWTESNATWSSMNKEFDSNIENYFHATRSGGTISGDRLTVDSKVSQVDITDLVQRWYNNEPNYGLMLKAVDETYNSSIKIGEYYTKNAANDSANPQPRLILNFKNLNGLEGYLTYTSQSHELGSSHINNYNGNLTTVFSVANTIGGPLPASIELVYNTADVISNKDYGYGLGVKPNLIQTIKEVNIDTLNVLEYLDEDGTIHYFYKNNDDNCYYDEDGLSLKVELIGNNYIMTDKDKNTNTFINHSDICYLEQITDTTNKSINIEYDDTNRIVKVIDASNKEITISYEDNKITFISPYKTTVVNLTNNQISSIEDMGDTTTITYNENKLIEKIINSNGLYTKYEYINDLTYKVSKVTEYGRNDSEGNYLEFTYNLKSTLIKDRKGHVNTYVFNNNANTEVITNLDKNESLSNAYGKSYTYGETGTSAVNKITIDSSLVRHINNLIEDSSFESGNSLFTCSNSNTTTEVIENAHYGIKALKVVNTALDSNVYLDKVVEKGNDYTFSVYIKNEVPFELSLSYDDTEQTITIDDINTEYSRCDITINYPETALSDLRISIRPLETGIIYIDGLQLEVGEVANYYNMISNSNFSDGLSDYQITTSKRIGRELHYDSTILDTPSVEVVTVDDDTKALKLINSPLLQTMVAKSFYMSGHAGDVFELSFWYKNEGPRMIASETNIVEPASIVANLHFNYLEGENDTPGNDQYLTEYNKDWHYFSKKFVATHDYNEVSLNINDEFSCRDCYITNISLFKDLESYSYTYDDDGNLVSQTDLSRETSTFNYNGNNQLIEETSPLGNKFKYEYDENVTDRLIRAISPSGITNSVDYDENNNPIKTIINNTGSFDEIIDTIYYIRAKVTDRYMYIKPDKNLSVRQCECSHDKFNVIKQTDNKVKLQFAILNNYYLKDNNGVLKVEYGDTGNNIFELIKHSDKTYSIKSVSSSLAITVSDNNNLSLSTYNETNDSQHFLFERMESKLFIEASATYTDDGRFIKSVKDSLGNVVTYDIDSTTGLTNSLTDPYGITSIYTYDSKHRVTNIRNGEQEVSYVYDTNDNLSNAIHGSKDYSFEYDDFNNRKNVKINNINLVENTYEDNNGNLTKIKYGNGHEIQYTYDEYDRIKTVIKSDDIYKNYYDNLGRITKFTSNDEIHNYEYDFAKRLSKVKTNDYETSFAYDKENNVITKKEKLNDNSFEYNYTYNNESSLTGLNIDNNNFSYEYDKLGRITSSSINGIYNTNYSYITNGNKTTTVINKVDDNGTIYSYKYDKLGNITEIKKGNSVINKYYYDKYSQLIKDEDLINNKYTEYLYDNYGNILSRKTYTNDTLVLLSEDTYSYNNSNWQDQLTQFNDETITYDEIGNPLTIGNKTLTWKNGKELATYSDEHNTISYKYNIDGIRTEKVVNGNTTKYHLEGTKIVFEDRNDAMIYYIYNNGELLGFKYNGITYYYHKNRFNDIIGILDSNYNEVVSYEYDSWGAITNIVDNSNINLGTINPFRYRSYYYDEETKLYYLNSRYYNPVWKRFINIDTYISAGNGISGHNMYLYCENNPVVRVDIYGESLLFIGAMTIAGGIIGAVSKAVENIASGESNIYDGCGGAFVSGAINGFFAANPFGKVGKVATLAINLLGGVSEAAVNLAVNGGTRSDFVVESVVNFAVNYAVKDVIKINPGWFKPTTLSGLGGKYSMKVATNIAVQSTIVTAANVVERKANNQKKAGTKKKTNSNKIDNPDETPKICPYNPYLYTPINSGFFNKTSSKNLVCKVYI